MFLSLLASFIGSFARRAASTYDLHRGEQHFHGVQRFDAGCLSAGCLAPVAFASLCVVPYHWSSRRAVLRAWWGLPNLDRCLIDLLKHLIPILSKFSIHNAYVLLYMHRISCASTAAASYEVLIPLRFVFSASCSRWLSGRCPSLYQGEIHSIEMGLWKVFPIVLTTYL